MTRFHGLTLFPLMAILFSSCASAPSSAPNVVNNGEEKRPRDLGEGRKVIGNESGIVVNAEIYNSSNVDASSTVIIDCEVENRRQEPIAIADIIPSSTYDAEARTIVVQIGSEVPGTQLVPRLFDIKPGEKRKFSVGAHMNVQIPHVGPMLLVPRQIQVIVNFLGDVKTFARLLNISEKAVNDPVLASELFAHWVERNETVITNAVPVRWSLIPVNPNATSTSAEKARPPS